MGGKQSTGKTSSAMINTTGLKGAEPIDSIRTPQPPALQVEPWGKMPTEVVGNILQYMSRNDLKACRLVDKRRSHEATRALFRTIVFAPSMTSIDKINKLAQDPRFARYVQATEIHRYPIQFTDFESALDSSLKEAGPEAESRMEQAFNDEVDASKQFLFRESPEQASELWQNFSQLPHIFFTSPGEEGPFLLNGKLKEESVLFPPHRCASASGSQPLFRPRVQH